MNLKQWQITLVGHPFWCGTAYPKANNNHKGPCGDFLALGPREIECCPTLHPQESCPLIHFGSDPGHLLGAIQEPESYYH